MAKVSKFAAVFAARERIDEAERLSSPDSLPPDNSLSPQGTPLEDSLPLMPVIAYREGSLPSGDSLSPDDSPSVDFWAGVPQVAGFTKFPHRMIDHLYSHLDPIEQALYTQLFRLSHGHGKETCTIGLPKLGKRANVSKTATQAGIKRLEGKGLIVKERHVFGKNKEQGVIYRLPLPDSLPPKNRLTPADTIKDQRSKEINKRELASLDTTKCPDCSGTGFIYVADRAVEKCSHPKLNA